MNEKVHVLVKEVLFLRVNELLNLKRTHNPQLHTVPTT
jgi:hypothetical protein